MPNFEDIAADFNFLDDWEDRYKYVIELGKALPELTPEERSEINKVRGCASQVWLVFDETSTDKVTFRGDSDAHIVKGLVALMVAMFSGKSKAAITAFDAETALSEIDLKDHISPQRSNGLSAMIKRIKAMAIA